MHPVVLAIALVVILGSCSFDGDEASDGSTPPAADGRAGCATPEPADDGGVQVEAVGGEIYALGLASPAEAGEDVKIVWRVTGEGALTLTATSPAGRRVAPTEGPSPHAASSFDRPGDEWGSFFLFDKPGCWEIEVRRGEVSGSVPISVV